MAVNNQSNIDFSISGNTTNSWMNGDYKTFVSSGHADGLYLKEVFNPVFSTAGTAWVSAVSQFNGSGAYIGANMAVTASNGTTYNGLTIEMTFPFWVDLAKIEVLKSAYRKSHNPVSILGSDDGGTTYDLIGTFTPTWVDWEGYAADTTRYVLATIATSPTKNYSTIRYVIQATTGTYRNGSVDSLQFRVYGDVYAY